MKIIKHVDRTVVLQQYESQLLFCETDENFETCSWVLKNKYTKPDCNSCTVSYLEINEKQGNQCNECMENITWNVTSKRCGIQITEITPLHLGEYQCVMNGFGDSIQGVENQNVVINLKIEEYGLKEFIMDHLLTYIIPGIVISVMLVLAIIFACILKRKQRGGKLNLFYSESFEKPKDPIILEDEITASDREVLFRENKFDPIHGSEQTPSRFANTSHDQSNSRKSGETGPELDKLLKMDHAPIHIDPDSFNCNSRPSPIYKKRQVI